MEQLKEEMKQKRNLLGKSKALVEGTVRKTAGGVKKTAKKLEKGTKATGKVALKTTKKVGQAGVATATLDRKMLMDAVKIPKKDKKREALIQNYKQPSRSRNLVDEDHEENTPANFGEYFPNPNSIWMDRCTSMLTEPFFTIFPSQRIQWHPSTVLLCRMVPQTLRKHKKRSKS